MEDFDKATKQHLLGEMGPAIVQTILLKKGIISCMPINVLDPRVDLEVFPNYPDRNQILQAQVKTKAPWVYEAAQSFEDYQWQRYQSVDGLFVICAPAPDKYAERDIWAGNVYWFNPKTTKVVNKRTKSGRDMVLIPLADHKPLKTITNPNIIELMKRLVTEDN